MRLTDGVSVFANGNGGAGGSLLFRQRWPCCGDISGHYAGVISTQHSRTASGLLDTHLSRDLLSTTYLPFTIRHASVVGKKQNKRN